MGLLNWILGRDAKNVNVKAQLSVSGSSNAARKNAALVPLSKGSKGSNSKKAGNGSGTDYVLEAQKLFLNMGLAFTQMGQTNKQRASRLKKDTLANEDDDDEDDSSSLSSNNIYRNLDILWRHETTRGCIFTGNERAASNLDILVRNKITSVINCTRPAHAGTLPNYHANTGRIRYYDFPVACWHDYILYDDEGDKITNSKVRLDKLTQFLKPMLAFVDKALAKGENVLIHCLAGAHRAGTTSIMCLMHYDDLTAAKATRVAKSIRPVIDPISDFPRLLEMFEKVSGMLLLLMFVLYNVTVLVLSPWFPALNRSVAHTHTLIELTHSIFQPSIRAFLNPNPLYTTTHPSLSNTSTAQVRSRECCLTLLCHTRSRLQARPRLAPQRRRRVVGGRLRLQSYADKPNS